MPSRDAQWVIGTIVVAVIALSVQIGGIRGDLAEIRTDIRGLDTRLRAVEVDFAKVDQRLVTLERVFLPALSPGDLPDSPVIVDDGRGGTDPTRPPGN